MASIQVISKDPNFSYIIRKNPASGMQLRKIRKGTVFGWYSQDSTAYNIYFKDADNAVSYGDQEFEYLNTSRYNTPVFIINAISEFFSSNVKEQVDLDTNEYEKKFIINMIEIKNILQIEHFERYFPEFKIELSHYVHKSYKLQVTTNESFHKLFNYINLLALFIVLTSDEYIYLDQNSIEKYLKSIERLDAPYFIRYLFKRNMIRSNKQFIKYKEQLEKTNLYDSINLIFGDTSLQRRNEIKKLLKFDKSILDIGCGEGFYAIPFAKNLSEDRIYHAVDIDQALIEQVMRKAEKKNINNIKVYDHVDKFINENNNEVVDIILTEVIEHMPLEESKKLIQKIVHNINFDKFIITVPNRDFNQFYMLNEDEFRHPDHDWEPTKEEFINLINELIPNEFKVKFFDIGDQVNNIATSIGCLITNT